MGDEIGAKIVLSGDATGAKTAVQGAREEVQHLGVASEHAGETAAALDTRLKGAGASATAAARAQALLNTELHNASPAQLQAVEAELRQLVQSGQLTGKALEQVNAKLQQIGAEGGSRLKAVLGGLGGELTGLAEQIPGISQIGSIAGAAVPEVTALVVVVTTLVAALKAASEKQVHTVGLDSALEQQGLLTDAYREKLQALAGTYGKVIGGGTAWLDIFKQLTQRGVDGSQIEKYAAGIKNLAGAMDGDLAGAAHAFELAMAGHYRTLEILGFQVDKTRDKHGQLEDLMQQFARRGGQMLEERNKTLAGSFERLQRAGGNFLPALGRIIDDSTHAGVVMDIWAKALNFTGSALSATTPKLEGMTNKLPTLEEKLRAATRGASEAGEAMEGDFSQGADSAKEAADSLAKDGLEQLAGAMGRLTEKTREANKELETARRRADELDDADLAEQIVKIKAGPGTEGEKATAERAARQQSTQRKEQRLDHEDAAKFRALEAEAAGKTRVARDVGSDAHRAADDVSGNTARQAQISQQYEAARKERQIIESHLDKPIGHEGGFGDDAAFADASARRHQLEQQMKAWEEETKSLQAALPTLQAAADARKQIADKAAAEAEGTAKANAAQEKYIRDEQAFRHNLQQKKQETATIQAAADDKQRAEKDREKLDQENLAAINAKLKDDDSITPHDRRRLMEGRRRIEDEDAAKQQRGMTPALIRATEFNRKQRQQRRDEEELSRRPADAAVIGAEEAEQAAAGLGPVAPNTVAGAAVAQVKSAAARVEAHGGRNSADSRELASSLSQLMQAVEQWAPASSASITTLAADVRKQAQKLEQLASQLKNSR